MRLPKTSPPSTFETFWHTYINEGRLVFLAVNDKYGHFILYIFILASAICYFSKAEKTAAWLGIIAFLIFAVRVFINLFFVNMHCDPTIHFC